MSDNAVLYSRDFKLVNLLLHTAVGKIDIRYIMVELSYQEDLFNNVASGYVMVTEGNGYNEFLSMVGCEFLELTFNLGGDITSQVSKIFRIYKMDRRQLSETMYTESYCLQFCSEELFISEQYKVSKSYKNATIDSMITDLCTGGSGIKTLKINQNRLHIDPTYGLYNMIVPNLKPLDAINWLSTYALDRSYPGADMVFFENKNGFNFTSLQNLMANGSVYGEYKYEPKNIDGFVHGSMGQREYNALSYEIINSYDTLNGVNVGMFANRLLSLDVMTRTTKTTDFDYLAYSKTAGTLNNFPVINNFTNRNGDRLNDTGEACLKLAFTNFDNNNPMYSALADARINGQISPNIDAETYIPNRTAQLSLTNYIRLKLTVPGDPGLTVGNVITFDLLSNSPTNKAKNLFYSGKYIITAARHILTQSEYHTVLEIAKDSVPNKYADNPTGSTTWNELVK